MDATQTHNRTRTKTKLDDGKPDYVQLPSEDQVLILHIVTSLNEFIIRLVGLHISCSDIVWT